MSFGAELGFLVDKFKIIFEDLTVNTITQVEQSPKEPARSVSVRDVTY
jgi:hypothetical protein